MANAVPVGAYERALVAIDFSETAKIAVKEARKLGLLDRVEILALHAFEAPAQGMMVRSSMTADEMNAYVADEEEHAAAELSKFLREVDLRPTRRFVQLAEVSVSETIRDHARKHKADLVVTGTSVRTGPAKFLLGSVAEDVLRSSDIDVLVVPLAAGS
jgi:nucleotide-binding universal stress UspA family protein